MSFNKADQLIAGLGLAAASILSGCNGDRLGSQYVDQGTVKNVKILEVGKYKVDCDIETEKVRIKDINMYRSYPDHKVNVGDRIGLKKVFYENTTEIYRCKNNDCVIVGETNEKMLARKPE